MPEQLEVLISRSVPLLRGLHFDRAPELRPRRGVRRTATCQVLIDTPLLPWRYSAFLVLRRMA